MGQQAKSWILLLLLGILLIIIGFTGKLGMLFAVAFTPGLLAVNGDGQVTGGSAIGTF